jgi:hypothetical protein
MLRRSAAHTQPRKLRIGLLSAICAAVTAVAAPDHAPVAQIPESQQQFLKDYCFNCHNAEKQSGKVRLDNLSLRIDDIPTAERWQKVLASLNSGEMPPEDKKQPPAEDKTTFLELLSRQMVVARKALADSGGTITLRRLNRREYVNTLRDLLDVEVNAFDLPSDENASTFDTVGSGLFFSSDQLEQYLKLARAALDDAIVTGPRPERRTVRVESEEAALREVRSDLERTRKSLAKINEWRSSGRPAKEFGFGDDVDAGLNETVLRGGHLKATTYLDNPLSLTGSLTPFSPFPQHVTIPGNMPPGRYLVRTRLAFAEPASTGQRFIEFGAQGDQGWPAEIALLGCHPVSGTPERPDVFEFKVNVSRTGHRVFAVRERIHNRPVGQDQQRFFAQVGVPMDTRQRRPFTQTPRLWVDWMEWEGPLIDQWPPRSHRLALGEAADLEKPAPDDVRSLLAAFAARAFRGKPVRTGFIDRLMVHFEERTKAGEPFLQAIKTPLSIILASPRFLYLLEPPDRQGEPIPDRSAASLVTLPKPPASSPSKGHTPPVEPTQRVPLTNAELANRLSYFLWASPPDERLMDFVKSGRLGDPRVLSTGYENEVDRMLTDRKVERFIAGFVHQWLHMTRLDFFQFNARLYPKFDGSLRNSARREVYETVRTLLADDLPIGTLLKSDFVVVDDLLADYYGLKGVQGSAFRKVSVPEGVPRGGLLGMAAILAMGSDGERSSPVERGAWVLRKLLNDPPPPAPANVPQLSRFGDKLMPARELLNAHQEQPQCAQCHRRIDPIGFALQNFDAAGLWRDQEYAEFFQSTWKAVKKKELFPINPSGTLPNGTSFEGFHGLRDAVASQDQAFARGLIESLIEYSLGRPTGFSDHPLVENILKRATDKGMTLRAIIHALIESREFLTK